MQALSHSPFLQALGYAIANSFWQVALLWLIVFVLTGVVKTTAKARYTMALSAQLTGFAWFILTFRFYYTRCAEVINSLQQWPASGLTASGSVYTSTWMHWVMKVEQLMPYLSVAYLFLLVFLAVKWSRSYYQAQQIRQAGLEKISPQWRTFVQQAALQLGIKAKVNIHLSSLVKSPLTVGFLKPVILIPLASINHLTTEQMEAVLLHELAHIKRADYIINLLQTVIEITLFFNPFTRLLSNLIRKERENSCDDWVLQFQYHPAMYAQALLSIARLQQQPVLAMPATGAKGDLLPRVKRMLNQQENEFHYKRHLSALLLITGILVTVAWLFPASRSRALANNTTRPATSLLLQPVAVAPISVSIKNPLFSPVFFLSSGNKRTTAKPAHTLPLAAPPAPHTPTLQLMPPTPPTPPAAPAAMTEQEEDQAGTMQFIQTVMATPGAGATRFGHRLPPAHAEAGMAVMHIFAAFTPKKARVHPPFLIEDADTILHFKHGRGRMELPPLPAPVLQKRITAAIVLERMLNNGNDSINLLLKTSIAQAGNSADSMTILRQFYKNTWQQFRQRRIQAEIETHVKKLQHWAFYTPVYIEKGAQDDAIAVKQTETPSAANSTTDSCILITGNNKQLIRYQHYNGQVTITVISAGKKQEGKEIRVENNAAIAITEND